MPRLYHVLRRSLLALTVACAALLAVLSVFAVVVGPEARAFADTTAVADASSSAMPAPSAAPATAATPSASPAATAIGEIKVRDRTVFTLRAARGGRNAQDRARAANAAIDALLAHPDELGETRFEETQTSSVVYVGKTPIVTLGEEDVAAAGEASLAVLSAHVTARLSDAVAGERKRSAIATTVFSFSLLVFSALIAFLLLGRASDVATRARTRVLDDPERIGAVRLGNVEFVSAGAARGTLTIALTLGHRLVQVAIVYGWLIFALSLFDSTRGYTERLTGMVLKPLSSLAERIGGALPLVVVAAIAVFAVSVLVRFVGLFFESVERGATHIAWVPAELARPTSALVRFGVIVTSLVLATPLITGESDGALTRAGLVALTAVALATTPLLASAAVGVTVVFGRRFKKGDLVEVGGRAGKVLDVTLFEVRLEDPVLAEISVPHLLGLVHATRIHRHAELSTLDIVLDPAAPQAEVEKALFEAARAQSARGSVELVYLDDAGAHWRVTSAAMRHDVSLAKAVRDALDKIGVKLGRGRDKPGEARGET